MVKNRTHSINFKRRVAQDYLADETLHRLAKCHDLSRNPIRMWVRKSETGALE
jgi:transposase-like protein